MPMHTILVTMIQEKQTQRGQTIFDVYGFPFPIPSDQCMADVYTTESALKASICAQAWKANTPLLIASRETRYGLDIVSVAPAGVNS